MDVEERLNRVKEASQTFLALIEENRSYLEDFHQVALELSGDMLSGKAQGPVGVSPKEFFEKFYKDIENERMLLEILAENILCVKRLIKLLSSPKRLRWSDKLKQELETRYLFEGLPASQIAENWGVSLDSIKSSLKRLHIRKGNQQKGRQRSLFEK
ncbi:MAG: hypothetical protein JXD19_08475 [Deltaproteobacteria bacterium]|nr:hypothetical protein [Deltaproteobacteria bacterium]